MKKGAILTGLAIAFVSTLPFKASAEEPYTIGVSIGLTGVQAAAAQRQIKGIELAVEKINARGGVHGRAAQVDRRG